ncbi:uncharacterized protein NECHADRAFT_83303 [Fusarium vanettenii 77-13-4]|uniref:Uncharacterized protein n=1 Tax=Fusarium vanettenii (strain ATCC MYA-4622 / CBS 123669 / FGSC 9596 / NRRL 45880 / 77-13-4) TaxID=660122 RepID=C7Z3M6_FUSV7|nr:uncharacterized protein NECHADRAFT_83303 [Fusarium vanettenii 77-13-4]EEU41336.1 predicted protein [Fusarium vanettenii 77-13-4]
MPLSHFIIIPFHKVLIVCSYWVCFTADGLDPTRQNLCMANSDGGPVPGVLVVDRSRIDKRDWLLNIKEMKKLIKGIKRYISGYKTISKHMSSVNGGAVSFGNLAAISVQERDDVQFVALVEGDADDFKPGHSTAFPKWVTKDDELPRFDALLRTYEGMCHEDLDQPDWSKHVGYSKDLRTQMKTYRRESPPQINRHLGLAVHVLVQTSLSVVIHVGPVLLIWEKD